MEPKRDTFNETVSSLLERKVRGWLSGVIEDMRRSSPVQQWLDSCPPEGDDEKTEEQLKPQPTLTKEDQNVPELLVHDDKNLEVPSPKDMWKRKSLESGMLTSTPRVGLKKRMQRDHSVQSEGYSPKLRNPLLRDCSLQSDGSGSSGSSVLNVLGARKVDAESVLLALGFGPSEKQQKLQRIPDRFLVPSKLKGISTEQFIKDEQHSMRMHDCGVFGYRGLTEHCTPVCRFMKPAVAELQRDYKVPQIAVQESPCTTVNNCS